MNSLSRCFLLACRVTRKRKNSEGNRDPCKTLHQAVKSDKDVRNVFALFR
jgi:hypothetical protein